MFRSKPYTILRVVFIISLVQWLNQPNAQAERVYGQLEPPRFKLGRFALKYEMDRFTARNNFGSNGKANSDLTGDFEAYNFFLGVENDLSTVSAVSAGILSGMARSTKQSESRRNTKVKGVQFGYNRLLPFSMKELSFIADAKYFQTFHTNSFGSDEVSVGDGTSWLQLGAWVGSDHFKYARLWFYGGINYPLKSQSKNFVFLARPEFKLAGGRLGVGLEGQVPIIDDKDLDEPTDRLRLIDEYNGGSLYYQPLNAEFVGVSAWFGFEPAPLTEIKIGLSERLSGRSAAQGLTIFLSVDLAFSVARTGYEFPYVRIDRSKSKVQKNNGIRRLKNYADPKKKTKEKPRKRRRSRL
jgi:hypothetical protein